MEREHGDGLEPGCEMKDWQQASRDKKQRRDKEARRAKRKRKESRG